MSNTKGMSGKRWRELKGRGPRFRWAKDDQGRDIRRPAGRSFDRDQRMANAHGGSPHARLGPERRSAEPVETRGIPSWTQRREPSQDPALWHTTHPRPWTIRQANRARNRRARAARRVTRSRA